MSSPYPLEVLGEYDDDGTMPESREALAEAVVGHRIVKAEQREVKAYPEYDWSGTTTATVLTLDSGLEVIVRGESDCCAYTEVASFFLDPSKIDHIITGVGTTNGYSTWHIYADFGDVMTMEVGWSCGNPFYYAYGFQVYVQLVGES